MASLVFCVAVIFTTMGKSLFCPIFIYKIYKYVSFLSTKIFPKAEVFQSKLFRFG